MKSAISVSDNDTNSYFEMNTGNDRPITVVLYKYGQLYCAQV